MRTDALTRLAMGALVLGACYQQHEPLAGGESHFLEACTSDCEGDLECIGDVCTRECADDDQCASLGTAVTCIGGGAPGRSRACGVACEATECDALGDGFTCAENSCRPVEVAVAVAEAPLVLFVIDTSGSMERLSNCKCTSAACNECLPNCDKPERNRWSETLEAFTGTFDGFDCEAQARTAENGASYDEGYFLPYHRPMWASQQHDGILDRYRDRVRFGMATFDGWDTYVGAAPLITTADFDESMSHDWEGLWSYGADDGRRGFLWYPNCVDEYRMDTGIRGPGALEGALTVAVDDSTYRAKNAMIQTRLLAVRPYGGTPIAGALDDVDYYFGTDAEAQQVPVRLRHVVLITDGYPDDDYRQYGCNCTQNTDPGAAEYCGGWPYNDPMRMRCPYPTAQAAARYLVDDASDDPTAVLPGDPQRQNLSRQIESFHVVGLAIEDSAAREELDTIAIAGGAAGARFATSGVKLRTAIAAILDDILANP